MNECKHKSPIYVVKRMRLYQYLVEEKELYPEYSQPDATNPNFRNWIYRNSPILEEAIEEYFEQLNK